MEKEFNIGDVVVYWPPSASRYMGHIGKQARVLKCTKNFVKVAWIGDHLFYDESDLYYPKEDFKKATTFTEKKEPVNGEGVIEKTPSFEEKKEKLKNLLQKIKEFPELLDMLENAAEHYICYIRDEKK